MWYTIGMMAARGLYWAFRGTLKKAINDPKRDWDEKMMEAADLVFGRKGTGDDRGEELE